PVHPPQANHIEQFKNLLIRKVQLQLREGLIFNQIAADELVGRLHNGALGCSEPVTYDPAFDCLQLFFGNSDHPRDFEMLRVLEPRVADDSGAQNRKLPQRRGELAPWRHHGAQRSTRLEQDIWDQREGGPVIARSTGGRARFLDRVAISEELFIELY